MNNDIKTENLWLMRGDCLERMKEIESGSVDMILTDPLAYCDIIRLSRSKWD